MSARFTLRRRDGEAYLHRWGWERQWGVFIHRMDGPDPGVDLHDHPWDFWSLILWGGYDEQRVDTREATSWARTAEALDLKRTWSGAGYANRGPVASRRWLSWKKLRLDECHRITRLHRRGTWTLVVHGPKRRVWGFYTPDGFVNKDAYERSTRGKSRGLTTEYPDGRMTPPGYSDKDMR